VTGGARGARGRPGAFLDRAAALAYGTAYDAVVSGFPPYEALVDGIAGLIQRSVPAGRAPARVLDVSCGTGTVAARLAGRGYEVVGLDPVARLVAAGQARHGERIAFHCVDAASGPVPESGSYDVVVSVNTLYWHPAPDRLLPACRGALRPGGHGVFLTYARPARVVRTFRQMRGREGLVPALRALRWLVPTAAFEWLRQCEHRYLSCPELMGALTGAGFEVLEIRPAFLADLVLVAWVRASGFPADCRSPGEDGEARVAMCPG
jgi:SAM-dependent methyltransferase